MPTYDKNDSLGARNDGDIAAYLLSIGDREEARYFIPDAGGQAASFWSRPYKSTGMVLGFIAPGSTARQVAGISTVQSDRSLVGQRIKITLDKFFVAKYPGYGSHSVLCEFSGKNQVPGETEELSFAMRFDARDNSGPAIIGAPIFMGLTVAPDGISFKGKTVNVKNSGDDMVMAVLDTPAFKSGLTLLNTAQPALKPLTSLATATVSAIAKRNENAQIHTFELGLDFDGSATSARLRYGSYIVVQTDEGSNWDWSDYEWNANGMALHPAGKPSETPNFNYMVFAVSPFSPAATAP
ncbi:MAG: hypothetical protein IH617_07740 [Hydrogenophaga sp.]|nr:hypothetical protein [Hydrogenophaga sp.]